jgi:hypothetical protein
MPEAPAGELWVQSVVADKHGRPAVAMGIGAESRQLTTTEARQWALMLLAVAEAAESEALVARFFRRKVGSSPATIAGVLMDFQAFREELRNPAGPDVAEPEPSRIVRLGE